MCVSDYYPGLYNIRTIFLPNAWSLAPKLCVHREYLTLFVLSIDPVLWIRIHSDSTSFRIRFRTAPDPKWIWSKTTLKTGEIWLSKKKNTQFKNLDLYGPIRIRTDLKGIVGVGSGINHSQSTIKKGTGFLHVSFSGSESKKSISLTCDYLPDLRSGAGVGHSSAPPPSSPSLSPPSLFRI